MEALAMANKQPAKPAIPEIVAHRGFSYVAPENTLAAIRLAWQTGCPAAECDVYLTRDRRIMLMHDDSAKRTAGADLKMAETDSAQLRTLDAGSWKDAKYAGEKIPFLEEVLETIPEGRILFIEIKSGPEILPYLNESISKSGKADRLAIICFNLDVIAKAKKMMPSIPAHWLVDTEENKLTGKRIPHSPDLIRIAKEKNLDGLDVHYAGVTAEFAESVLKSKLKLYTWTVDDAQEALRLQRLDVHGITTNRPDYLTENLRFTDEMPKPEN
jgi:glycerophosphoryl diester phosphodiesterase